MEDDTGLIKDFLLNQRLLFHFTNRIKCFEAILPAQRLKFSLRKNFDDIAESTRINLITDQDKANITKQERLVSHKNVTSIEKLLNDEVQVLCFCKNSSDFVPDFLVRPRMWSQYSRGTDGVCLVFDETELMGCAHDQFEDDALIIDDVTYEEGYPLANFTYELKESEICSFELRKEDLTRFVREQARDLYFIKHCDYVQENEKRFVLLHETDEQYLYYGRCLKAVILGSKFPSYLSPLPLLYRERLGIKVYQMQMISGTIDLFEYNPIVPPGMGFGTA